MILNCEESKRGNKNHKKEKNHGRTVLMVSAQRNLPEKRPLSTTLIDQSDPASQ